MKAERNETQSGFSLVELIVAMVVTLIVSGAIFGLLSGSNTAFRREPELSDRQQNIRVAMDLIQKDIGTAGMEMADFVQAFTQGDGPSGSPAPPLDGLGPMGPNNEKSDFLQIFGNTGECPSAKAEPSPTGVVIRMMELFPNCYNLPALVMLVGAPGATPPYSVGFACPRGGGPAGGGCGAEACANFPPGQAPNYNLPGGDQIPDPLDTVLPVQVVRYEIRVDADGVPNLWRSPAGNTVAMSGGRACGAGGDGLDDPWQLVAKGIEDLQVKYTMADGTVADTPAEVIPPPFPNAYGTLVKEVRVTLIARSEASNLLGSRTGTNSADPKLRGSMTSSTTPRAALFVLSKAPTPEWR